MKEASLKSAVLFILVTNPLVLKQEFEDVMLKIVFFALKIIWVGLLPLVTDTVWWVYLQPFRKTLEGGKQAECLTCFFLCLCRTKCPIASAVGKINNSSIQDSSFMVSAQLYLPLSICSSFYVSWFLHSWKHLFLAKYSMSEHSFFIFDHSCLLITIWSSIYWTKSLAEYSLYYLSHSC